MKSLIVCVSVSHGNTRRVAEAMAEILGAPVVEPGDVRPSDLGGYDLVGFGSGVYAMAVHPRLRRFIRSIPREDGGRAFVFTTRGGPEPPLWSYAAPVQRLLERRGFEVLDTFSCRGFDTWLPLRLVGGLNKGRPNGADLDAARAFARRLAGRVGPAAAA